ncbi:citrate synthase [Ectothiorhodospiraceae bacterium BW-2]|nr:citrate synthase [Ectothiorhodospiraceae bacterium BW-2]
MEEGLICTPKTDVIENISESIKCSSYIDLALFDQFNVKRGLRNADHSGVLVGLTNIGEVVGYQKEGELLIPVEGELYYRGISVNDLVRGIQQSGRYGFDEVAFLLLTGRLPTRSELEGFENHLADNRELNRDVVNSFILSLKGSNMMNVLARTVLGLYTLDTCGDDTSHTNLVRQSLELIAKVPAIIVYAYFSMRHKYHRDSLIMRYPQPGLSTAENFLYMLKGEEYTPLEAELLDLALILHAEHGGGNNSSFTIRVTSSSGTDTYSAIASALASLKGPLHGGANLEAQDMMDHIKANISDWDDEAEIRAYIANILRKEAYDGTGKVYGIGHAIYTLSDPRAVLLKERARELAKAKGREAEFRLFEHIERLTPEVFSEIKGNKKVLCANVDFYSGFVYTSIGIPKELYTALFAMARIAGWCAHRIEELNFTARRIIRPAYRNVFGRRSYIAIDKRGSTV